MSSSWPVFRAIGSRFVRLPGKRVGLINQLAGQNDFSHRAEMIAHKAKRAYEQQSG